MVSKVKHGAEVIFGVSQEIKGLNSEGRGSEEQVWEISIHLGAERVAGVNMISGENRGDGVGNAFRAGEMIEKMGMSGKRAG